ncbi:Copper amine oxidase N-terminal domain-containing protein [Fontibacillus panacisegetis]|uniref:Copper amine oxidase N-terminal domain-containing protein n=1 Tax=Fontibacillus panacisegetis TaxID=670482 RepID=A0A1G7NIT1_9BACL|nr:stalk domain-containing protein [Fontibacillus panacisegetis]SDF73807.1 Copper amine oxidase N-terminal domain-containing protein [Fontibacillus panacisegetis]
MIKRKKLLLFGAAIALALSSFAIGAAGAGRFQLIVNGKTATTEVKVINNTTYVPLRAVSEMLGAKVTYDSATGTITINSEGAAVVPSTPPSQDTPTTNTKSSENSRLNPAEIGTTLSFAVKNIVSEYSGNVSISQVIRGDQAWQMIHEANMFNNEPTDGYEYMLVKAKVTITKNSKSDAAVDLWGGDFTLVSATGTAYDTRAVVTPDPKLDASIYVGSSNEGWVAFQVKKSDESPLIVFERKYDGSGGVWFKTK